jgi:hypothetical protein
VWISPYKKHPKEIGYMSGCCRFLERIWILLVPSKIGWEIRNMRRLSLENPTGAQYVTLHIKKRMKKSPYMPVSA